ncbi:GntR family transcriptional regulator [Priestia megaterium]|jgi:DNA-binding GntR family transcriptional regulator|uniref:GntR family transcriptional regulator n=1 Tax=Priestia megaterium TaxID=1404 RepID=UPI001C8EA2A4|nr:GntR family transcriptional regulator [Priestia megaterium]MBY0201319.1 GntR family transcriptional regulator [Priestia megaterium]
MKNSKTEDGLSLVPLKDKVKEVLRDDIILNNLKPGDRIVETEVAKKLGISQVPVREALRGLEEEGLIKTVKYKGAFVTEIDKVEMYHIFSLRAEIETNTLELVIPKLTNKDVGELYDIVERMKNGNLDYLTQSKLDMEFHRTIIQWSRIEAYNRIWAMLNSHIRRYITALNPEVKIMPDEVYKYHLDLIKVLEKRDIENAKATFREHIMKMVL